MPDRVKESLFALLRERCEGAMVLDLFAGTGSVGLEAVSRGAERCVLVERDARVAKVLQKNIDSLGCGDRCEVVRGDALGLSVVSRAPRPLDLVFMDPPYDLVSDAKTWPLVRDQAARLIALLKDDGFLVLRTPWPAVHEPESASAGEGEADASTAGARRGPRRGSGKPGSREEHWRWRVEQQRLEREQGRSRGGGGKSKPGREARGVGGVQDDEAEDFAGPHEPGDWFDASELHLAEATDESASDPASAEETPAARPVGAPIDLRLAGAAGPETHVYRHTALHLYVRAREG